jgi:hypothetical protein
MKLVFGKANAKLRGLETKMGGKVFTFSLLSGHTCPYAKECLSKAVADSNGKRHIEDGPHTEFRCFSASQEVQYTGVYDSRKNNGDILGVSVSKAADVILAQLPKKATIVRIHVGGDFKTQAYFDAWVEVARRTPNVLFYAYTKSLPFWVKRLDVLKTVANFVLTASRGGWKDSLIDLHNLRETVVVYSEAEAAKMGLEIDHDDSHAADPQVRDQNFALLIHGTQPKGSHAANMLSELKQLGWTGYGKEKGRVQK